MKKILSWIKYQLNKPIPVKLNRQEKAILQLASYLEDSLHHEYRVRKDIANILGIIEIK